jgi:predicted DNA-binding protein
MEAIEAKLESMEDLDLTRDTESIPVHQGSRQTMSHVMRAVQKAGLSAVDAQKVAQSIEEALAAFDAQFAEADVEVQVHTDVIADAVIPAPTAPVAPRLPAVEAKQPKQPRQPKAISKAKRPKRLGQPKPQETKRSKQRDQKVEDILRQIKSLVKQLEQVEADADATSTLR